MFTYDLKDKVHDTLVHAGIGDAKKLIANGVSVYEAGDKDLTWGQMQAKINMPFSHLAYLMIIV